MWDTGFGIYVDTAEFAFFRVPFKLFLQVSMIQQRSYEISVSESNYQSLPVHNFQASTCFEHAGSGQNSKYFELNHCLLHLWFLEFEFTEFQPVEVLSAGSYGHPNICRRPCILFTRGTCQAGADCNFCHVNHDTRQTMRVNEGLV